MGLVSKLHLRILRTYSTWTSNFRTLRALSSILVSSPSKSRFYSSFDLLLQRTGKLQVWWWFVFIITIPCAVICICTEFMVCPAFGARILGEKSHIDFLCYVTNSLLYQIAVCVSDTALKRQITVLYTVVVLDILTDLF